MEYNDFYFFDMAWDTGGEKVEELPKNMFVKVKKELPKHMFVKVKHTTKYINGDIANMMEEISNYWGYQLKRVRPVMASRVTPEDLKCTIVDINGNPFTPQA